MSSETPTIQDVARVAGVSTATVSRALSTPDRVSEKTRTIVLAAVSQTGYVANENARNLRQQRANAICVIAPDLSNPFFSFIISGIEQIAGPAGYGVFVTESGLKEPGQNDHVNLLASARVDGFIVLDGKLDRSLLKTRGRSDQGAPIVSACEWNDSADGPAVTVDNVGGAMQAVQHLSSLGHRKIGHITGPATNILTGARIQGYRLGLEASNLPFRSEYLIPGEFSLESGKKAAERWLALDDRPTAMFCSSDREAFGFISYLSQLGIRCPEDVSVVGFDDIEVAGYFVPALTTISQPRLEIGRVAAKMLLDRINGDAKAGSLNPQLDVSLVIRESTAAPTAAAKATAAAS